MKNILLLLTSYILLSCYDIDKHLDKIDEEYLPKLEILKPYVLANGSDSLEIKVIFPLFPNQNFTKVNFVTSEGVFFENGKNEYSTTRLTREINKGRFYISAILKSTTTKGRHLVTIEVPEIRSYRYYANFSQAYPSSITLNKNKFSVARTFTDEIQFFANLSAPKGLPSKGTPVEFVVDNTFSSDTSKLFRGLTKTDANGQASVYFTPGLFGGRTGTISFKAIIKDESGKAIEATGSFEVVEPEPK